MKSLLKWFGLLALVSGIPFGLIQRQLAIQELNNLISKGTGAPSPTELMNVMEMASFRIQMGVMVSIMGLVIWLISKVLKPQSDSPIDSKTSVA